MHLSKAAWPVSERWTALPATTASASRRPPFQFDGWLNSAPLSLADLRGRVVLIRWWTDTCPFCASSAPALRALHDQYSARGLTVIGVFHPKAGRDDPLDVARVQRAVESRQFVSGGRRLGVADAQISW